VSRDGQVLPRVSGLPKLQPSAVSPLERLAKRICIAANTSTTVGDVVALEKQRTRGSVVDAAVELALARQWLKADGPSYSLTQAGTELRSDSRRGAKTRRVMPF
jgi:hypothetical protein